MRKILFIAILLALMLSSNSSYSQSNKRPHYLFEKTYRGNNPDGFSILKNGDRVAFGIDYSKAIIRGLSEADNSDLMGRSEWEKAKTTLRKQFLLAVEESLGKKSLYLFGPDDTKSEYRIIFQVNTIEKDGDIKGTFILFPINDNRPFASVELSGKGGRIGDFLNLMGDGHRSIGDDFGKFLKSSISKRSPKSIEEYKVKQAEIQAAEEELMAAKEEKKAAKAAAKEEKQQAREEKQQAKIERQNAKEAKWKENIKQYERSE